MTEHAPARTPESQLQRQVSPAIVVLLLMLLATFVLYLPGSYGPLIHDDYGQINLNPDIKISELSLENLRHVDDKYPSRPLPMLSFALNYLQCGDNVSCYKITNIVLHLATGLALCFFLWTLRRIGARRQQFELPESVIIATAALWLLHPLLVSTTLYVVQRMAILCALFSLIALACYLQARFLAGGYRQKIAWLAAGAGAGLLAVLSKESALLIVPLALLLELLFADRWRARIQHPLFTGMAIALALLAVLGLLAQFPPHRIAQSYLQRDFLPMERLLTEARILWYYASEVLWPDQSRMSFYLDHFRYSRSLLDPAITLAAVGGWLAVLGGSLGYLLKKPSLPAFGIIFFLSAHALESTVVGLVPAYEHRNYLAAAGLLLAVAASIHALVPRQRLRIGIYVLLVCLSAWQLVVRVDVWSSTTTFINHLLAPRWENSYGATIEIARHYDQQASQVGLESMGSIYAAKARTHYTRAADLAHQPILPLTALLMRSRSPAEARPYWRQMQEAARTGPVTPDVLNATNTMALCLLAPAAYCSLSRREFSVYIDTLIANPRKGSISTSLLKRAAGTFYVKIDNQPEKGLALSRQAAAMGMVEARESYIKNLGFLGRSQEAEAAYARLAREVPLTKERRQRIEAAIAAPGVALP